MKLRPNQLENLTETLEDFRALLPRYQAVKNDPNLLKKFCVRNRNPIWDLTNSKYFKTGLKSELAKDSQELVDDHFIQRSRAMKFIFEELEKNPDMDPATFLTVVKKYSSTVKLTKEEHSIVSQFAKKNPDYLNYETYLACGIKITGLNELMLK